jgi:hypothetical protein
MVMPSLLCRLIIPYFYPCPKPSITIPAGSQVSTHSVLLQNFSPLDEQGLEYYKGGDDERRYYTRFEPVIYNLINGNTRFELVIYNLINDNTRFEPLTYNLINENTTLLMRTQSLNP